MGKRSTPRALGDNEAMAFSKHIRVSAQKLNLVASLIRGLCEHPPIYRECPPPDWLSKAISQAVAAQTSRTKAPYYHLEYEASVALLNTSRKGTSSSCSNSSSNNSTHTV